MSGAPQQRVAAGRPAGGQFLRVPRLEADVDLTRSPDLIDISPGTARILEAVTAAGGRALLVGGCVRDALLGLPSKDVDIEVYGLERGALLDTLGAVGRVDEVGQTFSVLTVSVGGERIDVALPRTERRTGPGHRDFEVEADPHADTATASARRDLTINALLYDPASGEVIDHWGGVDDLRAGILRHTTDAFAEDPLRVLRLARFAAKLDFAAHPDTVELARGLVDEYETLSRERVWGEWAMMASTAQRPSAWLDVLQQTGWERHFPEIATLHGIEQDPVWHPEGDVHEHARLAADEAARLAAEHQLSQEERQVVVLAAMLHDVGKATHTQHHDDGRITSHGHDRAGADPAAQLLRRIGAPKDVVNLVVPLVREHMVSTTVADPTPSTARRLARRLAPATIEQWALVSAADQGGRGAGSRPAKTGPWLEAAAQAGATRAPVKGLLTGKHLIAAGMAPGPEFSTVLAAALSAQDDGAFGDEAGAVAWLEAFRTSARHG